MIEARRAELERAVATTPAVVWLGYTVHGNEASGVEAALATLYQLAAGQDAETRTILDSTLVLIDPVQNPDGHERHAQDTWRRRGAFGPDPDPNAMDHEGSWPGARTIIDWNLKGKSIFDRKKPLKRKTLERIYTGFERFGTVGLKGEEAAPQPDLPTATLTYSLGAEAETLRYVHDELRQRRPLALSEAEMVVGSLSVAMHSDQQLMLPLLRLRNFDEYTTTHSLNVSVLAMAVGEFLGQSARDVRAFGLAGLMHDLGKVTIPEDILRKPGKLSPEERAVMNAHPVEGARIIIETEKDLDLAAVVSASFRLHWSSSIPPLAGCAWASWKPGSTIAPSRSRVSPR